MKQKFILYFLIFSSSVISSCDVLLKSTDKKTKEDIQKLLELLKPPRANTLILPPNKDRIPTGGYVPGEIMQTTITPYGIRYRDYIFNDYEISTDVYKRNAPKYNGGTQNLVIDIVSPKNDTEKKRPCLLFLFGGAFKDKGDDCTQEIGKGMAQKGYVVALIDYRLGFTNSDAKNLCEGNFMTDMYEGSLRALQDARSAIRYLKANANKLGIDENKIFISGNSAGAITSLAVAFVEEKDIPQQQLKDIGGSLDAMNDNIQYDTKVAGVFALAGGVVEENVITKKTNIPICLMQGNCDELIDLGSKTALNCDGKNATYPLLKGSDAIYSAAKATNSVKFFYVCNGGHLTFKWGHLNILDCLSKFTYSVIQGNPISGKEIIKPVNGVCSKEKCE